MIFDNLSKTLMRIDIKHRLNNKAKIGQIKIIKI